MSASSITSPNHYPSTRSTGYKNPVNPVSSLSSRQYSMSLGKAENEFQPIQDQLGSLSFSWPDLNFSDGRLLRTGW